MNIATRGQAQTEQIVIRVAPADKANIKLEAQKRGVNMSTMIKGILIDNKIIDAINADF